MAIIVCAYDPSWPALFAQLAAPIRHVLRDYTAIAIEHVGSTAVPGLVAKPVIDMDIVVQHPADIPGIIAALAPLGYTHQGDLGIAGREAFSRPAHTPAHNLYLGLASAPSMRNHLLLRDYLRQHPPAVLAYGQLKQQLAQQYPDDIDAYVAGKSQFIADILTAQGMDAQQVADIRQQNQR